MERAGNCVSTVGILSNDQAELLLTEIMKSLEEKSCSRCGRSFTCGPEKGEERCWCDQLSRVSLAANADQDCLCPQCLREAIQKLNAADSSVAGCPGAVRRSLTSSYSLVAGEDYYSEGEAIVFTARYHLRRGYCCENGCRHCPFAEAPMKDNKAFRF